MLTKKRKQKFLQFVGLHFLYYVLIIMLKTLKIKTKNEENIKAVLKENRNFVLAFWHGTMLIPWYRHKSKNFTALISQSKDGEILTRILERWNYQVVRGSSHIGGKEAFNKLLEVSGHEKNIAITPDGPTGPVHEMKAGAVIAAKKLGIPLFLLGVGYEKKYILKSWDKFEIPKPFSKVSIIYSDPINIAKNLSYDETSELIKNCEQELKKLQGEAANTWSN